MIVLDEEEKLLAGKLFCPGDDRLKAIELRPFSRQGVSIGTNPNQSRKQSD